MENNKKIKKKKRVLSLRAKLLFSVIGCVLLFLSFSTYFSINQTGEIIKEQLSSYGNSMAHTLADFSIEDLLSWNYPAIQLSIDYIGKQDEQILRIKIYHENIVVAEYISDDCKNREKERSAIGLADDCEERIIKEGVGEMYEAPVLLTTDDGDIQNLGKVQIYLSNEKYNDFLGKEIRLLLILSLVLLIGDTILSYLTVKLLLLNPLKEIMKGTKIIGKGNFNHFIKVKKNDEIGELANEVNNMTKNLKSIKKKLTDTLKETKNAKNKIEEEQHKISAIISNLVDPVIVMDNERRITLINPSAKSILKLEDKDIGRRIEHKGDKNCMPDSFCLCDFKKIIKAPYESHVTKVNEDSYPIIEELALKDKNADGKEKMENDDRIFKVFTSPVKDEDGNIFGAMKIFYDLTREKKIDNIKSKFISVAAHQLRTPSSGVKWALQMILDGDMGKIPAEPMKYLKKAAQANQRMVTLIDDLLNISRMEAGKIVYKLEKIDLEKLIDEIINDSSILAVEKNIKIEKNCTIKKILEINADREKIKLSIQNLVTNAIKYSKIGGSAKINIYKERGNKDNVCISVEDQGIGISEEDQKKLFGRFFRGDNAIRSQTEGSGLGLFIVKGIVEAHKGEIWYQSEIDKGSTFFIKLPIALKKIKKKKPEKNNNDNKKNDKKS